MSRPRWAHIQGAKPPRFPCCRLLPPRPAPPLQYGRPSSTPPEFPVRRRRRHASPSPPRRPLLATASSAATTTASASGSGAPRSVLRAVTDAPTAAASSDDADALFCDSWRLSVETDNAGPWRAIPARCLAFVQAYMEGPRYASDSAVAAADSLAFASAALAAAGVGAAKPAWVFDVDETLLTNAPYYAVNGWGSQEFNETSFDEWVDAAKAPAIPSSLKLYKVLQGLGFHIILLTGRTEFQRNSTVANLLFAGFQSWEKLILRQPSDVGKTAELYKSERRAAMEAEGFKILGNSGDQWSDLIGTPMATRSFKLPNPMYFIS